MYKYLDIYNLMVACIISKLYLNNQRHYKMNHRKKQQLPILFGYGKDDLSKLQTEVYSRLELFKTNEGTSYAWSVIIFRLSLGLELLAKHYSNEGAGLLLPGIDAAMDVFQNNVETKTWIMSVEQIEDIREALTIVDEVCVQCTRRELQEAFKQVRARTNKLNK